VCDLLVSGASVVKTLVDGMDVVRACYRHIAVVLPTTGWMSDGFRQMFQGNGDTSGVMNPSRPLRVTRDKQHQHILMRDVGM
jgi:hypothetical protein